MTLRDYSKIRDDYHSIIPKALRLLTERLDKSLDILAGGRKVTLTTIYGTGGNSTVQKTKLLANFAPFAFEDAAEIVGIPYKFVDGNGYDVEMDDNGVITIEEKMTLGDDNGKFATGNNHSKVKNSLHFVLKLKHDGNIFTEVFAALVDVPNLKHKDSGWDDKVTSSGKNNNGFSGLKVHISDIDCVTSIYGTARTNVKNQKRLCTFVQTDYVNVAY